MTLPAGRASTLSISVTNRDAPVVRLATCAGVSLPIVVTNETGMTGAGGGAGGGGDGGDGGGSGAGGGGGGEGGEGEGGGDSDDEPLVLRRPTPRPTPNATPTAARHRSVKRRQSAKRLRPRPSTCASPPGFSPFWSENAGTVGSSAREAAKAERQRYKKEGHARHRRAQSRTHTGTAPTRTAAAAGRG